MTSSLFICGHNEQFVNKIRNISPHLEIINDSRNEEFTLINDQPFSKVFIKEEMPTVIRLMRQKWSYLQMSISGNCSISYDDVSFIREELDKIFKDIIYCILHYEKKENHKFDHSMSLCRFMDTFECLVTPLHEFEDSTLTRLCSNASKHERTAEFQYLHTYFEVECYLLICDYISERNINERLMRLTRDLFSLSNKLYQLKANDPFPCDCYRTIWTVIQKFSEKVETSSLNIPETSYPFWGLFNEISNEYDGNFVLWLLMFVAHVQSDPSNDSVQPNFPLIEKSLKNIFSNAESPEQIYAALKSISPLLSTLWLKNGKIEIYQQIWEYFGKRLNRKNQFHPNVSLEELVNRMDTILYTLPDCQCEFELFLALLVNHLSTFPQHWGKMKGRFYTQLGPNKMKELNNIGIYRVLLLFVCLTKISFEETASKFVTLVDYLPFEKKHTQLVWTFYMLLVIRHVRENKSINILVSPMLKMLDEATNDHNYGHLIKGFCKHFDLVIKNSSDLQLQQSSLINNWIDKYMSTCYYTDLVMLLQILMNTIDRIINDQVWNAWDSAYKDYVFYSLKNMCLSPGETPAMCGLLAAKITVLNSSLLEESFIFFNGDSMLPEVASSYLCGIIDNTSSSLIFSEEKKNLALRSWTRICMFTKDKYDNLTRNILKLSIFPDFAEDAIRSADDPLNALIESVSANTESAKFSKLNALCENCFGNVDQWICSYFADPKNEAIVLRVLTLMALAFFKIGKILYDKHKNSLFSRFFPSVLLSTPVMMGKPLNPFILNSIKKTWHLFFESVVKLNSSNDLFIDRILKDLVVKYIPYFDIADSPMLKCLNKEILSGVILEKMSNVCLKHPINETEGNVSKCLRIVSYFTNKSTSPNSLKQIVDKTLYNMLEIVMFHPQRNTALTIVKTIISSPMYPETKSEFEKVLGQLTDKHLPYKCNEYFQLMSILAKFIKTDIKNFVPTIKQRIVHIEQMRGVGYDKNLRARLQKFEESL